MPVFEADEYRHTPGDDPQWQESIFFIWNDPGNGIGGVSRMGLEPRQGKANLWCFVGLRDAVVYHRTNFQLPLPASDWNDLTIGPMRRRTVKPLSSFTFSIHDQDIEADLTFDAIHEPFLYWRRAVSGKQGASAGHFEGSGNVTGSLAFRGKAVTIQGVGHHDHSWGARRWNHIKEWVWLSGVCDGRRSFNAIHAVHENVNYSGGYLFNGTTCVPIIETSIGLRLAPDGRTHAGVTGYIRTNDGKTVPLTAEVRPVGTFRHEGVQANEGLSRFSLGNDVAFGVAEWGYGMRLAEAPNWVPGALLAEFPDKRA